jgi:hypothetical protein
MIVIENAQSPGPRDGLTAAGTLAEENGMSRLRAGASCLCPWCVSADLSTRVQQRGLGRGDTGMHWKACTGKHATVYSLRHAQEL